jgi:Flp pilus assembly pilin Flp
MKNCVMRLWRDEAGFIVSTELILIVTILVISLVVGLASVRDAVVQELADIAQAIGNVNQTYSWTGITGHTSLVQGSLFTDFQDFCETTASAANGGTNYCVTITIPPAPTE